MEENRDVVRLITEIPGYSINEAGQLQRRAMSGSELKLLVSRQSAFFTTCKILASGILSNNLPIVSKKLMDG